MKGETEREALTVRLLVEGDPEGLRRLVLDHGPTVRRVLLKEFRDALDEQQVDEAMSQAAQRAWKSRGRVDPRVGTLRAWLLVISRNCARRVLQTKRRGGALAYVDDLDSGSANGAASLPDVEIPRPLVEPPFVADLRRCIEALPRMQRAIVLADLAAGGSAPGKELAASLKTSTNSVYVSRNHARRALRKAMLDFGHDFDDQIGGAGGGLGGPPGAPRSPRRRDKSARRNR